MLTIRVYGRSASDTALELALRVELGAIHVVAGDYGDDYLSSAVVQSDLLLCFVDAGNSAAATHFIARIISRHGAWSYLPILVVGFSEADIHQRSLYRFGASRYLEATATEQYIAKNARKVVKTTWWQGERSLEIPVFVVDSAGTILRVNESASRRFGENLLGRSYTSAVEGGDPALPATHPIAKSLSGDGRVVGTDHKVRRGDGQEERYFLHCSPIHTGRMRPHNAAVILLEMSRWERLVDASIRLGQAKSWDDLFRQVVGLGADLGFHRVRLYEHMPERKVFKGQASVGFVADKARWFVEQFEIPTAQDELFRDIERASSDPPAGGDPRKVPLLYVRRTTPEQKDTDIVHYFDGLPTCAEELDKTNVRRWIEAPIWLQAEADGRQPERLWGKISIDPGPDSDELNERDVGDVAVYCRLVSDAIAALARGMSEQHVEESIRKISEQLVEHVEGEELLLKVVALVLQLYQTVTRADVVVYRQIDEYTTDPLRRVGEPVFRTPELAARFSVPHEVRRADCPDYYRFFRTETAEREPYIAENAAETGCRILQSGGNDVSGKERAYLSSIRDAHPSLPRRQRGRRGHRRVREGEGF